MVYSHRRTAEQDGWSMSDVSKKLLETHRDRAAEIRFDKMLAAWREWRAEIIKAMAARVGEASEDNDRELANLHGEFLHCNHVLNALEASPEDVEMSPDNGDK
jgi:hypothetical protein